MSDQKKADEKYIEQIRKEFADLNIIILPLHPGEVKGMESLNKFKTSIFKVDGYKAVYQKTLAKLAG